MSASLCTYCGAEGAGVNDLPPDHEWGWPCPKRDQTPCRVCAALPGELCTIVAEGSPRQGEPTADHKGRTSPSMAFDVIAPRSIGNVVDLATARAARR